MSLSLLEGIDLDKAKKYLVERTGSPLEALPGGGGVVNVYFVVKAESDMIVRHNDPDEIVEVDVKGYATPAITDTKLDGAYRRTLVQQISLVFKDYVKEIREAIENTLKQFMNSNNDVTKAIATALLDKNYARLKILDNPYTCAIRPYGAGGKEYVEGLCGECPNCYLFGYAVAEEERGKTVKIQLDGGKEGKKETLSLEIGGYNIQSRVRGDLYPATAPSSMVTEMRTHNAVDDATKTTGQALFNVRVVKAGTIFVGKLAYYDVSLNELLLLLATLVKIPRLGASTSDYGKVRIYVPALLFADQEVGSGYEMAEEIVPQVAATGKRLGLEEAVSFVKSYVDRFKDLGYLYTSNNLTDKLYKLNREWMKEIVKQAWVDTIKLKISYEHFTTG